jgi:hypothetical protein
VANEKPNPHSSEEFTPPPVKRKFAILSISVFLALLILPMLIWGTLKLIPGGTDAFDIRLEENRKPFEMPVELDLSKLTSHLESYFNDRIPFRNLLISSHQKLTTAFEAPYKDEIRPFLIRCFFSTPQVNIPTPPGGGSGDLIFGTEEETTPSEEPLPDAIVEIEGDPNCSHRFGEKIQLAEATCAAEGWGTVRLVCIDCGHAKKEFTPRKEHTLVEIANIAKTCLKDGKITYECSSCHEKTETILRAGHTSARVLKTVAPTCEDYGYTLHRCSKCFGEYRTDVVEKLYDTSAFPLSYLSAGNGYAAPIEGKFKWLFYSGDNTLDYYTKINALDDRELENLAALIKELYTVCEERGKTVQLMVMPMREHIYAEYMPTISVEEGSNRVQKIVRYMKKTLDIEIVYPYEDLLAAKPYWQVAYRLDTHWNAAGGFVGTQALYRALGMETVSMYNLPILEIAADPNSKYDLVWRSGSDASYYGEDNDYFIEYKPEYNLLSEQVDKGGDENEPYDDIRITTSSSPNRCNFVMIADSYRLNMEPYLIKDFSNCLFTHRRRVNEEPVRQAILESDIIVIAAAERLDNELEECIRQVINILKSNP